MRRQSRRLRILTLGAVVTLAAGCGSTVQQGGQQLASSDNGGLTYNGAGTAGGAGGLAAGATSATGTAAGYAASGTTSAGAAGGSGSAASAGAGSTAGG